MGTPRSLTRAITLMMLGASLLGALPAAAQATTVTTNITMPVTQIGETVFVPCLGEAIQLSGTVHAPRRW